MSFSSKVKNELCQLKNVNSHCRIAEISAIVDAKGGASDEALSALKIASLTEPLLLKRICCRKAYIRGAFIACASISDPEKGYHLEFVYDNKSCAEKLIVILQQFSLKPKTITRKGHCIVYLKEGENIVDLLNIIGAHQSLLNLENLRIVKDMRNNVNRKVNCETANLSKTVSAAIKQINDIKTISHIKGLEFLSKPLEEVAKIRLKNEQATLQEIGAMLSPPVGKSGVNHRLRKISEIAYQLRER